MFPIVDNVFHLIRKVFKLEMKKNMHETNTELFHCHELFYIKYPSEHQLLSTVGEHYRPTHCQKNGQTSPHLKPSQNPNENLPAPQIHDPCTNWENRFYIRKRYSQERSTQKRWRSLATRTLARWGVPADMHKRTQTTTALLTTPARHPGR